MFRIIRPLLFLLARTIQMELVQQIQRLKAENEILRFRLPHPHDTGRAYQAV